MRMSTPCPSSKPSSNCWKTTKAQQKRARVSPKGCPFLEVMQERIFGFPPVVGPNPRVLILGSMPSVKSLAQGEYYAHPRNAFWRIQAALFDEEWTGDYALRVQRLKSHGIALWDSAASCVRPGSLDSAITAAMHTDVPGLLSAHPTIGCIAFNGKAAQKLFLKFHGKWDAQVEFIALPSTSPAAAAHSFAEKLAQWRCILEFL